MCHLMGDSLAAHGNVEDLAEIYANHVMKKLANHNIYLVFDQYYDISIKNYARSETAHNVASWQHLLTLKTSL